MKRLLELLIVVGCIFFLIYFLLYMLYFDSMCTNFKKDTDGDYAQIITQMGVCKGSLVCGVNNVVTNEKNIITDWTCDKKINNSLELNFYLEYFADSYNNFLSNFENND